MCVSAKLLQSCPALCGAVDSSPPAPLSMGFPRQEYWTGLPFAAPRDLPDPGTKPTSPMPPALAGRFFITSATWSSSKSKRVKISSITGSHEVKMMKKIFEKVNRT